MKKLIPLVVLAACAASCSTRMYVSNAVNAPLLKERGEITVNVTQNDLQAAVAVGRNIGVMANGYYNNYNGENDYRHYGMLGEAAVGYFTPMAGIFVFETYAGFGAGKVYKQQTFTDANSNPYMAKFDANATKIFVQPDIGIKTRYVDAVISSRFSAVKYTRFSQQNYTEQELRSDYLDNGNLTRPTFVFAEPAVTLRAGYKFVKLQFQYGLTINLTGNNIRQNTNFSSLGLVFDIGSWYND